MQDNPYQAMLSVMGGEAGRQFLPMVRTGVVVSVSPLTVQSGDLTLDAGDLLIDPRLLAREREVTASDLEGTADFPSPPGTGTGFSNGSASLTAQLPGELAAGDQVALITPDGERFIVLCKAVALS